MDFKTFIDEIIKKNVDILTKNKKLGKLANDCEKVLHSLFAKNDNPSIFIDHFGKIQYCNNAFLIMLKNDKNKKDITSIYDIFSIDATFSYDDNILHIRYENGFEKIYELKTKVVNLLSNYMIHLEFTDISKVYIKLEASNDKVSKLNAMLANIDDLSFVSDADFNINYAMGKSGIITDSSSIIDNNIYEVFPTAFCNEIKSTIEKGGELFTYTIENGSKNTVLETKISKYKDQYIFLTKDISNLNSISNALNYLSSYDVLTGFLNASNLSSALDNISDPSYLPVGIKKVEIKGIKEINKTDGYEMGDTILKELSSKIKHLMSGFDIGCRVSGEIFAVIFPNTSKEFLDDFDKEMTKFFDAMREEYSKYDVEFKIDSLVIEHHSDNFSEDVKKFIGNSE